MLWCVILVPKGANNSVDLFVVCCVNIPWLGYEACVCMVVCGLSPSQTMAGVRTPVRQLCTHQERPDSLCVCLHFHQKGGFWPFPGAHCVYIAVEGFHQVSKCTDLRSRDIVRKWSHNAISS